MFMENLNNRIINTENKRGSYDGTPLYAFDEILLRLPAKSVARFRAVNKYFESISRSPSFISKHFEYAKKCSTPSILIIDSNNCIALIELESWQTTSTIATDHDGLLTLHSSSCNGLVCLSDKKGHAMILNPTSRDHFMIPKPINSPYLLELGYDSSSEEYKVLQMYPTGKDYTWEVLTVGDNSWRQVATTPDGQMFSRGIYMDGVIYWVVYDLESVRLLYFNFKEERLNSIDQTKCDPLKFSGVLQLLVVGGRLGIAITLEDMFSMSIDFNLDQMIEIWVMGDATDEWSLGYTLMVPDEGHFQVCFLREKKFVLYNLSDNSLYYYDVETNTVGSEEFELPAHMSNFIPHVESLVTLKGCAN